MRDGTANNIELDVSVGTTAAANIFQQGIGAWTEPNGVAGASVYRPGYAVIELVFTQNGANIDWFARNVFKKPYATLGAATYSGTMSSRTFGRITDMVIPGETTTGPSQTSTYKGFGHVRIGSSPTSSTSWDWAVETGLKYAGLGDIDDYAPAFERAEVRIERICDNAGVAYDDISALPWGEYVGRTSVQNQADVLKDTALADGGLLVDNPQDYGLWWVPRWYLSGSSGPSPTWTLDVSAGDILVPREYTKDNQRRTEDVTIDRPGGGSARYRTTTDPTRSLKKTRNMLGDTQLQAVAEYELNVNNPRSQRIPKAEILFHFRPALMTTWLTRQLGQAIRLENLPEEMGYAPKDTHPNPGRNYTLLGWEETISIHEYQANLFLYPTEVRETAIIDTTLRNMMSMNNTITNARDENDTTFTVDVTSTTSSFASAPAGLTGMTNNFFMLDTGEEVSVTDIAVNTSTSVTYTVVRARNGISKTIPIGTTFWPSRSITYGRGARNV